MARKNIFSILLALFILYLSLVSSDKFQKVTFLNIPYIDKLVHFGMYFALMSVIIFENRKRIRRTWHLFLAVLIPLSYGILMEIFQTTLTSSRTGNCYDILFDSAGIFVSLLLWLYIKPVNKESIK